MLLAAWNGAASSPKGGKLMTLLELSQRVREQQKAAKEAKLKYRAVAYTKK